MAGFDWQTDAEGAAPWPAGRQSGRRRERQGRWSWLVVALGIGVLAILLLRREARLRVLAVEEERRAEILAVHGLAQEVAARGDEELFRGLLSGRDPQWVDWQLQRLQQGLLFSRAPVPFGFEPFSAPAAVEVALDPAQREAFVVGEGSYQVTNTVGVSQAVRLRRSYVYRRGGSRWYLSPPGEDFWGEWRTVGDDRLQSVFRAREEKVILRLHQDLATMVDELCALAPGGAACGLDDPIRLRFSPRPQSILEAAGPEWALRLESELVLPTPSLVGEPLDESGYRALFRGYARRVVAAVTARLVDYRCCRQAGAYAGALLKLQSELGLRAWPLQPRVRTSLLTDLRALTLHELEGAWQSPDPARRPGPERNLLYLLIDYYVEEQGLAPLDLAARIAAGAAIDEWFPGDAGNAEKAWRNHVFQTVRTAQVELESQVERPRQDLLLSCYSSGQSQLYRYSAASDRVTNGIQGINEAAAFYLLIPLPGDRRVVLAESRSTPSGPPRLWRTQGAVTVLQHPEAGQFFIPARPSFPRQALDPDGRFLPSWIFNYGTSRVRTVLLDLESCQEECSEWQELADNGAFPVWSPDGAELLWTQDGFVKRGDPATAETVSKGSTPFWLDDETYGYLSEGTIFLAQRTNGQASPLLNQEQLLAAIPEAGPGYRGFLNGIEADPAGSGTLIFSVNGGNSGDNYLLLLAGKDTRKWQASPPGPEDLTVLLQTGADIYPPPHSSFSPQGRWFAARTRGNRRQEPQLLVYDVVNPGEGPRLRLSARRFFESYDWSADGSWLARPMSNYVLLVAPEGPTFHYIFAPSRFNTWSECSSVAWIHPE